MVTEKSMGLGLKFFVAQYFIGMKAIFYNILAYNFHN